MERKTFIKTCGIACLGSVVAGSVLVSCSGYHYVSALAGKDTLSFNLSEFSVIKDGVEKKRAYVLVRNEGMDFPICVYRLKDGGYSAVRMECTHSSCELVPHGEYLICPCHGSEFSNLGHVQNPPAEADLITYNVSLNNETITIHLS